jgi:hypothetical protein
MQVVGHWTRGLQHLNVHYENTTIKKDEEDGNKLEDGMNHSNLTTKTSLGTPIFRHIRLCQSRCRSDQLE